MKNDIKHVLKAEKMEGFTNLKKSRFFRKKHLQFRVACCIIIERENAMRARLHKICDDAGGGCPRGREFPLSMSDY